MKISSENKNKWGSENALLPHKSRLKAKSKILALGLMLVILVGMLSLVLSPVKIARAEPGNCVYKVDVGVFKKGDPVTGIPGHDDAAKAYCIAHAQLEWIPTSTTTPPSPPITTYQQCINNGYDYEHCKAYKGTPAKDPNKNALYESLTSCPPVDGCIAVIFYWLFYSIPSFLLGVVANFFDVIIALTLYSNLYTKATFIGKAWTIVRDFSNIFFILILLYAAIQIILGIGNGAKKIIAQVIITALLINFSMFFAKVIIDSSNILALIFYNKIDVVNVGKDGKPIGSNYIPIADGKDKGVSEAMVGHFDPTRILSAEFFDRFRKKTYTFSVKSALLATGGGALAGSWIPIIGTGLGAVAGAVGYTLSGFGNDIPLSISVGFILVAGLIIIFATYAFFIAGISFLSRMIELWILIIFAPFAFMSFSLPLLADVEYIGWKSWIKNLLRVAFMAPIFMFFLYLIFMVIKSNIFISLVDRSNPADQPWMETIILMVIPALIILILLMKATSYAKKASGEIGNVLIKGTEIAMGVAGGLAIGGAAAAGQASLGHAGKWMFESKKLTDWETAKNEEQTGRFKGLKGGLKRFAGSSVRSIGGGDDGKGGLAGSSFDARKGAVGGLLKAAGGISGLNLGHASTLLMKEAGGYEADLERRDKKRKARVAGLKAKEGEEAKQNLNKVEDDHQSLLVKDGNAHKIEQIDRIIAVAKDRANTASRELRDHKAANSSATADDFVPGDIKGRTFREKQEDTSNDVRNLEGERLARKNASVFLVTNRDGTEKLIDHSANTTNGKISEQAQKDIVTLLAAQRVEIAAGRKTTPIDPTLLTLEAKLVGDENIAATAITNTKKATDEAAHHDIGAINTATGRYYQDEAETIAIAAKTAAATALATNTDPAKIAALTEATKATDAVATAASEAAAAARASVANPVDLALKITAANAVKELNNNANKVNIIHGLGRSINNLEDTDIPQGKYEVERLSKERGRAKADITETQFAWPWNKAARKKSAHEIRMGVALDSGHGGKGGGN